MLVKGYKDKNGNGVSQTDKTDSKFSHEGEISFGDNEFYFLARLTQENTGIIMADHKRDMVYSRLVRRLRTLRLQTFAEYCELLQSEEGADEINHLINAITTNLTSFFREAYHFKHLRDAVIPALLHNKKDKRLRIWSTACSSGMEPYSIAMIVKEAIKDLEKWDVRILATDIDSTMLNVAREGEYQALEVEHIPTEYRKYVVHSAGKDKIRMAESLKQIITFPQLNLLHNWPMKGSFDVVFCRNAVIYFDKPTKQKLFNRIADIMPLGGWLYIGHSENLHNISNRFELLGRTIYRKVK